MKAVLGIDPAWTERQPSGVALVRETCGGGWQCVAAASSYSGFLGCDKPSVYWLNDPVGGRAPVGELLSHCRVLLGAKSELSVVSVDMPIHISSRPINKRRFADDEVSRAFGKYQCGVHSPRPHRPGQLGVRLMEDLEREGYSLAVRGSRRKNERVVIETYPHATIVRMLELRERLKYKATKTTRYWPECKGNPERRKELVLESMKLLRRGLSKYVSGIPRLPRSVDDVPSFSFLKRFEDVLDAIVCAWVGIEYLRGHAEPFGDETAAIWIPKLG